MTTGPGTGREAATVYVSGKCGHSASGNGFVFVCDRRAGHEGLHQQSTKLRDSVSVTNWGSDGLAPWATKDKP